MEIVRLQVPFQFNNVQSELVEMHQKPSIMTKTVIFIKRDASLMEQVVWLVYNCVSNIQEHQQHVYYLRVVMAIVWHLVHKPMMAHAVLRFVLLLRKIQLPILDVNHILTNVSLMVQLVLIHLHVRQLNSK